MRLVRAITIGGVAMAAVLALSAGAPAQADWRGGWHRGWGGPGIVVAPAYPPPAYYAPPPVVYTPPPVYYAPPPPPVYYAPGVAIGVPGISVHIR